MKYVHLRNIPYLMAFFDIGILFIFHLQLSKMNASEVRDVIDITFGIWVDFVGFSLFVLLSVFLYFYRDSFDGSEFSDNPGAIQAKVTRIVCGYVAPIWLLIALVIQPLKFLYSEF